MREPRDLRELVGDELAHDELERLGRVDELLRRVPPPPHDVPSTLTQAVAQLPFGSGRARRRRAVAVLAFAAVLVAALAFGLGRWTADDFDAVYAVTLEPTGLAAGATARVEVGERDEDSGNVELVLDVSGLPRLAPDEFYALWLERDGEWAATCGYFAVGDGETSVRMTVSYDFAEFDSWIVSSGRRSEEPQALLTAEIPRPKS